jgi:hypothetical protein
MSGKCRVWSGVALLFVVAGCGTSPSGICVGPLQCDEFFNYSDSEVNNAQIGCVANQGTWSTSDRCSTSGTIGSCRIPYTGDANAFSIERIYNATMDQEVARCASRNGMWAAN